MIEPIISHGADDLSTVGGFARTEAADDLARPRHALRARVLAALMLAFGVACLNVAVLLWLPTTTYAIVGAGALAAVGIVAGLVMSSGAWRATGSRRLVEGTRRVLAEELGPHEPGVTRSTQTAPITVCPAAAADRLHGIRAELREAVSMQRGVPADTMAAPAGGPRFEPRSRPLRRLMLLWRVLPAVPSSTALVSVLGVIAASSPRLRRLLAPMSLRRNFAGHPRHAERRPFLSFPS
jgi:hypothetical protein